MHCHRSNRRAKKTLFCLNVNCGSKTMLVCSYNIVFMAKNDLPVMGDKAGFCKYFWKHHYSHISTNTYKTLGLVFFILEPNNCFSKISAPILLSAMASSPN